MNQNVLFTMLFEKITDKGTTIPAILFCVCIFQNICRRVLWIAQICFSHQKLSNEHTMSLVRHLWIFDLTIGVADIFGAGGRDQNSKESRHLWSTCFWHHRSPYICLPACTAKKFFYTLLYTNVEHTALTKHALNVVWSTYSLAPVIWSSVRPV